MISYSTNWMGPVGMWWFRENGFVEVKEKVLEKDSQFSNKKKGDTVSYEDITKHWYGGRIDIYGLPENEYYNGKSEMALPIMDGPSWSAFSKWLESFTSEEVLSLDALVTEFEKSNDKIVWFEAVKAKADNKTSC